MAGCEFSEFSYGYCVVEDLIVGKGTGLTAAPIFPSLVQEGQKGYGYDVRLNRPGVPLFLQFKLVQRLTRMSAHEAKNGDFKPPFYRLHLRSRKLSDQHQSLVELEQSGNEVYYVAPTFHRTSDLDNAYGNKTVWDQSIRVRPSEVGPLSDEEEHHITFTVQAGWKLYSDEARVEGRLLSTPELTERIRRSIFRREKRDLRSQIEELDHTLTEVAEKRTRERPFQQRLDMPTVRRDLRPIDRIAYLSRTFFDCQLLFVTEKDGADDFE